jgi:L-seryl-tRNA(Ser) seleniumtransferase
VFKALEADTSRLMIRAQRIAAALTGLDAIAVESTAAVGGGGAPGVELPSAAVSLPERFAAALRARAVVGRVERGRCLLDLRTVPEDRDDDLIEAVRRCR